MRFFYNILFNIFFALSAPFYFLKMWRRGNWREGFGERFGKHGARLKQAITNRHRIWIHAVSVGEVNIATQLIRSLEARVPNVTIVVSTTTSTGMGELNKKLPPHIQKIYYPIDRRKFVSRALRVINPEAIVLVEAEIWPNFLWGAQSRRIPVFLVNARLSDRSFRGYRRFGFLFRRFFRSMAGVGVQNQNDAQRLIKLGCKPDAVHVVGNLKFDAAAVPARSGLNVRALLDQIGVAPDAPIIVAGSTHDGEEVILAEIYSRLKRMIPGLFLILVPRHHERGREVGKQLEARKLAFAYRTQVSSETRYSNGALECLLVNTTGELRYFYEVATLIFVGKSLTAEGGQNPIEPGALGKAMLFGPNMQNFPTIAPAFVQNRGAVQVRDARELEARMLELLQDEKARAELGRNALKVVEQNKGSIERTVDMIVRHLDGGELFIARPSVDS
jgi:3-deoxy-D-manno-octulosonic-acid transferase